ncbi:MAG: hypothetical protein LBD98_00485 [Endomicrobium sp.]|jgi:hypothetical protein|nr:hypothetical protein [Endomicrobium sp.]
MEMKKSVIKDNNIDTKKIQELLDYVKQVEPFLEKKGYDIGNPEPDKNMQCCINFFHNEIIAR